MTKKIYYEKIGRRYVPVSEYDSNYLDSFPKGNHLVMVYPGGSSRRFNVEPATVPMLAAGRVAEDAISSALVKAGELRLQSGLRNRPMTEEQRNAWTHLVEVFGPGAKQLEWPSAREVAEEGIKALQTEAEMLLSNEAVRKAYDHFILMCKLTKEAKNDHS